MELEYRESILTIQKKIEDEALVSAYFIHITGSGDPFGSPFFREWLRTMKTETMPNLGEIRLQTNAQLWTRNMWGTIPRKVQQLVKSADISIDAATPETYAINRKGGEFARLLENLAFIRELRTRGPLQWVGISMVVQENNFSEMPDFVRMATDFGFDTAYFSQLLNWGTYSAEEYSARAIHRQEHPRYTEFLSLLRSKVFDDDVVNLGNLTELREQ